MAEYKLYILDEHDWVTRIECLQCDDDNSAVVAALDYAPEQPMELWNRDRLIQRFGPEPDDDIDAGPVEFASDGRRFRRARVCGVIRTPARSSPPASWARRGS
jgi:hypothetical protein